MSKALNLPSIRTTQAKAKRRRVVVSVGFPTLSEISQNLSGFDASLDDSDASKGGLGFVVMVDECALEERPRYDSDRDQVIGLCREHVKNVDTTVSSIETLREIQLALDEGRVHRAKEATVISFGPFSPIKYTPIPVAIIGTCKTEKDFEHAKLLRTVLQAFNESPHGPVAGNVIFCLATDGDPTRRRAVHMITMSRKLEETSPIYPLLAPLALMNFQCGLDDITADIDFKHVFKRAFSFPLSCFSLITYNIHFSQVLRQVYDKRVVYSSNIHIFNR